MEPPPARHNSSPWNKGAILLFAGAIVLLIAGAFPISEFGVTSIYRSGLMLLFGLFIGVLSLFAVFFIRTKNIGLLLLHIGCCLILVGAYYDYVKEQKYNASIYIGEEYHPQPNTPADIAPPFSFVVKDFQIDYYSPTIYALIDGQTRTELEEGTLVEDNIVFARHNAAVPVSRMNAVAASPHPFLFIDETRLVYIKKRAVEKYYEATFVITDAEENKLTHALAVNHPVTYDGWRFYLTSHGLQDGRQYVQLIIRYAPGRHCVQFGIFFLIIGAFWFSFYRKRNKGKEVALS